MIKAKHFFFSNKVWYQSAMLAVKLIMLRNVSRAETVKTECLLMKMIEKAK